MDILRKELDEIYRSHELALETLPTEALHEAKRIADSICKVNDGCAVVTDAASNRCYVYSGSFAGLIGYGDESPSYFEADSSDEDVIYERIHPEDLVDKRFLEYEIFKLADRTATDEKRHYIARCRIRMKDSKGNYRRVDNTTQLLTLSPEGRLWLILCTYCLAADVPPRDGIDACIINTRTGETLHYSFNNRRKEILTEREKEILSLIRDGKLSKQIAAALGISINTVNRHRQNILEKLSVGNSVEAVTAATLMKLL